MANIKNIKFGDKVKIINGDLKNRTGIVIHILYLADNPACWIRMQNADGGYEVQSKFLREVELIKDEYSQPTIKKKITPFVYIRYVEGRGDEIIKLLEDLGAYNYYNFKGDEATFYYLDNYKRINCLNTLPILLQEYYIEIFLPDVYKPKDKEFVWAYNKLFENDDICFKVLGFYDAKNCCLFDDFGRRKGNIYTDYKPYRETFPEWAKKAQINLED